MARFFKINKMKITKESLIKYGMKETGNIACPLEKVISVEPDEDGGYLAISLTLYYSGSMQLTLMMPGGAAIYLNIRSIEELEAFEKCIAVYEPNY